MLTEPASAKSDQFRNCDAYKGLLLSDFYFLLQYPFLCVERKGIEIGISIVIIFMFDTLEKIDYPVSDRRRKSFP
jgi:hypothetical protein